MRATPFVVNSKASPRTVTLTLLLLAYIFNFVDRNIIGVLAVPIRAEFGLSDTALGTLGVAFGVVYAVAAVPIGWLADHRGRAGIIAGAVAVWSLFTAACGLAGTYAQLIAARIGVALGEAGGIAPSYALISSHFPEARRARALAIFSFGVPIGSALGIFFGGWLAAALSWRSAFLIVGLAGLPIALLIRLFVRDSAPEPLEYSSPSAGLGAIARTPSLWLLSVGAAFGSIPGYGLIFWLPSFFNRSFGLPVSEAGWFYGSIVLVGGLAGTWFGGWIGDRLGPGRPAAYALIPAICFLAAVPLFGAGLFAPSLAAAWLLFALAQMFSLAWLGPVVTAVQQIVPPGHRATASATFLFVNNLVGMAAGYYVIGRLSDAMKAAHGAQSLRYSIFYALGFYLLSTLIYLVAAYRLPRDFMLNEADK